MQRGLTYLVLLRMQDAPERIQRKTEKKTDLNPFELRFNRRKHDVLGQKIKGGQVAAAATAAAAAAAAASTRVRRPALRPCGACR